MFAGFTKNTRIQLGMGRRPATRSLFPWPWRASGAHGFSITGHAVRGRAGALLLVLLVAMVPRPVAANDFNFTPCTKDTTYGTAPPTKTVVVSILSIEPNSDLEGDDDDVYLFRLATGDGTQMRKAVLVR